MNLYLDTEFTGLHRDTTLISLALIAETGEEFYCELTDWDSSQINPWISDNVIPHLAGNLNKAVSFDFDKDHFIYFSASRQQLAEALRTWLPRFGSKENKIHIWADCLAYDWVLFCELFGGALNVPDCVFFMPFDLGTLFLLKGADPNTSRETFAGSPKKDDNTARLHNALYDTKLIKTCFNKLITNK